MGPDGFPGRGGGELIREGLRRGGFHWEGLLTMLLLATFVALLVWLLIRATRQPLAAGWGGRPPAVAAGGGGDPALAKARLRYANGELSREDYLTLVDDLGGTPPPPPEDA